MDRCVLVVEDEPIIRMDTVSMLEEAGLTVVEFDSADEALDFTKSHLREVAAIFTDVNLRGELSGIDLASIVTEMSPDITLLVTSGRFDKKPFELPDNVQFLCKPFLPRQVLSAIQSAVG